MRRAGSGHVDGLYMPRYRIAGESAGGGQKGGGGVPSYGGPRKTLTLEFPDPRTGDVRREATWIKDDYLESGLWATQAARDAQPRGRGRIVDKPAGW